MIILCALLQKQAPKNPRDCVLMNQDSDIPMRRIATLLVLRIACGLDSLRCLRHWWF